MSGHTLVMESLKLRVKAFKEENDSNNLTLEPNLGDSITQVWPDIERLSHIFAVAPSSSTTVVDTCTLFRPHLCATERGNIVW